MVVDHCQCAALCHDCIAGGKVEDLGGRFSALRFLRQGGRCGDKVGLQKEHRKEGTATRKMGALDKEGGRHITRRTERTRGKRTFAAAAQSGSGAFPEDNSQTSAGGFWPAFPGWGGASLDLHGNPMAIPKGEGAWGWGWIRC